MAIEAKEFELEKKKNAELLDQLSEKTRQFSKLQNMYDKLKRKATVEMHQQMITAEHSQLMQTDNFDGQFAERRFSASQNNLAASGFQLKRFITNVKR
jgi:hypothetical protein